MPKKKIENPTALAEAHVPSDTAPLGEIKARTECESMVFQEIVDKGKGTAKQLAMRLSKRGIIFTAEEIQTALDGWIERGWCETAGRATHLSTAAMQYLR